MRPTPSSSASPRSTRSGSSRTSTTSCRRHPRHLRTDFDLVVTAQQVRSYKPDPAHFKECARRIEGLKKNWVHIASGYHLDVEPCTKKIPVIWVNRHGEELESGARSPTWRCEPSRRGKLLRPPDGGGLRASSDALVVTSAFWQVNAVALRAGGEAVLIDSPYLPDELDALPGSLAGALRARRPARDPRRLRPSARTALLPGLTLGMAELSVERLRREPGAAAARVRDYDAEFYVERPAPLALGAVQGLPVPGRLDLECGSDRARAAPGGGTHAGRHGAVRAFAGRARDRRLPVRRRDSLDLRGARSRLPRDPGPAGRACRSGRDGVPGHGPHHGRDEALRLLDEDVDYSTRSSATSAPRCRRAGARRRNVRSTREPHPRRLSPYLRSPACAPHLNGLRGVVEGDDVLVTSSGCRRPSATARVSRGCGAGLGPAGGSGCPRCTSRAAEPASRARR